MMTPGAARIRRVSFPSGRRIRLLPIAVVVIAAILGEGLADREAAATAERSSTVDAVVGSMVSDLSVSHIRVEEIIAGDQTVDVNSDIVENQTSAATQCRVLREGGSSRFGRVDPFDDRTAAATVAETCRRLDRFRLLTERRLRAPLAVRRAGSPAETRYDRAFASFLTAAGTTQAELRELGRRERRRMQVVQVGIVVLLSSLVIASVLLIRRRDDQLAIAARDRESLLQSAGEGIVAFDRDGRLHFANGAAAAMLGWRPEELARHGVRELLARGDQRPSGLPEWLDVDRPSRGQGRELVRSDGSAFPVAYHVAPAGPRDDDGVLVLTFENISDRLLEESRREAELAELRVIKDALVPPAPSARPGLELATCYEPAQDGVAGDFYLVMEGPAECTVIVVGDVAGKGVEAARRAAYLRAALANFVAFAAGPRQLLEMGNRALLDATAGVSDRFVTAVCLKVDPTRRLVEWTSAGHPAPVLLDSGEPLRGAPGLPLGLCDDPRLDERRLRLEPGAGLLVHTDGLTEARQFDADDPDLLGFARVSAQLRERAGGAPDELAGHLRALVSEHSDGKLADDLCMVVLRLAAGEDLEPAGDVSGTTVGT